MSLFFVCGVFFSIQELNIYTLNSLKDECLFTFNRTCFLTKVWLTPFLLFFALQEWEDKLSCVEMPSNVVPVSSPHSWADLLTRRKRCILTQGIVSISVTNLPPLLHRVFHFKSPFEAKPAVTISKALDSGTMGERSFSLSYLKLLLLPSVHLFPSGSLCEVWFFYGISN